MSELKPIDWRALELVAKAIERQIPASAEADPVMQVELSWSDWILVLDSLAVAGVVAQAIELKRIAGTPRAKR